MTFLTPLLENVSNGLTPGTLFNKKTLSPAQEQGFANKALRTRVARSSLKMQEQSALSTLMLKISTMKSTSAMKLLGFCMRAFLEPEEMHVSDRLIRNAMEIHGRFNG